MTDAIQEDIEEAGRLMATQLVSLLQDPRKAPLQHLQAAKTSFLA